MWTPHNPQNLRRDYASLYAGDCYRKMLAQIDALVCHGVPFAQAKQTTIAETKLVIGVLARDWLSQQLEHMDVRSLSKKAVKAEKMFDQYPSFRVKGRTPDLPERIWLSLLGRR